MTDTVDLDAVRRASAAVHPSSAPIRRVEQPSTRHVLEALKAAELAIEDYLPTDAVQYAQNVAVEVLTALEVAGFLLVKVADDA